MITVNLKDLYSWITEDEYIEITEEMYEAMKSADRLDGQIPKKGAHRHAATGTDCQKKREICKLVAAWCANYDTGQGECLPLETGCDMHTKHYMGVFCRYFQSAVLPLDPVLETTLLNKRILLQKTCAICHKPFFSKANKQKYCGQQCTTKASREKSRKRMAKMRGNKDADVTK